MTLELYSKTYRRSMRLDLEVKDGMAVGTDVGYENPGPSVTNAAEDILAYVEMHYGRGVRYFERYPERPDELDYVELVDGAPRWRRATEEELAELSARGLTEGGAVYD